MIDSLLLASLLLYLVMRLSTCLAGVVLFWSNHALAQTASPWDVIVNGRAIHVHASRHWNEDNWGLGLEREFETTGPWIRVAMANGFMDSMANPSYMAGGGLKRRFRPGGADFYVDLGGVGFLMTRQNVNKGRAFPGVLPAATIGFKRIALNLTYLPEAVADRVTDSHRHDPTMAGVFFLQLKLDASLFGLHGRRSQFFAQQDSAK